MKSSVVFLTAASGLLAACNPSPEDFGPQREDVVLNDDSNTQEQSEPDGQALKVATPDSVNYKIPVGQRGFSEWVVEFRPQGDPETLCVVAYASNAMQCWKAPVNE